MRYHFYGNETKPIHPTNPQFVKIKGQRHLYELLSEIWCEYTCAPRMREKWSKDNKTCGQCSITAFLTQDIFGGEVYGVPLGDGNFHCFNKIGDIVFDLTSEQFHDEKLDYKHVTKQKREAHFSENEKLERYIYLKNKLIEKLDAIPHADSYL